MFYYVFFFCVSENIAMLRASAGSIKLTTLYGAPTSDTYHPSTPFANLLEIDGVRILLDCGWNDEFDVNYLNVLLRYLGSVHAVLFSTPELVSCGALPFVMEHIPHGVCVAAAGSTAKIGLHGVLHPFLYLFPNTHTWQLESGAEFEMTVDKIYSAFRSVTEPYGGKVTVRYQDVEVECHPVFSGRMLGAHGWLFKYQIDELFYCPDFSLKPSYVLKRFVPPTTATLLFVDGSPLHLTGNNGRKYEEQLNTFIREILNTLRNGKDVLIPTSVAGRGLEILAIVTHLLTEKGGDNYTVVFAAMQAAEILAKASTMTEVFHDKIILSEQQLFANVVTCKTAQEVMSVSSPKVCVADGESLDYGVSAELLDHFLRSSADERENLVVLPAAPKPHTNAFTIAAANKGDSINFRYTRRLPLGKEELEEYYLQFELELEEQKKALEGGAYEVVPIIDNDTSDSDSDTPAKKDDDAVSKMQKCTPGLVLPPYMNFVSKHLQFPILEPKASLSGAALKKFDYLYGLPISEELQVLMRKKAPARVYNDDGPEVVQLHNDAQAEANIPSKILAMSAFVEKTVRIFITDLSGFADAAIMRSLLKSCFSFAKKIVMIRGTVDDHRALSQFCRSEKIIKCGENVFLPRAQGAHLELATHVYSYVVQLDTKLANTLPTVLRRVKEARSNGLWDVGWVDGVLVGSAYSVASRDGELRSSKRVCTEFVDGSDGVAYAQDGAFTFAPLSNEKAQQCAREREMRGLQRGLFYVGEIELHRLRDLVRNEKGIWGELHKSAPLLVFDTGVCVRKSASGNVSLSSMVSPSAFSLRRDVYSQFSQIL